LVNVSFSRVPVRLTATVASSSQTPAICMAETAGLTSDTLSTGAFGILHHIRKDCRHDLRDQVFILVLPGNQHVLLPPAICSGFTAKNAFCSFRRTTWAMRFQFGSIAISDRLKVRVCQHAGHRRAQQGILAASDNCFYLMDKPRPIARSRQKVGCQSDCGSQSSQSRAPDAALDRPGFTPRRRCG